SPASEAAVGDVDGLAGAGDARAAVEDGAQLQTFFERSPAFVFGVGFDVKEKRRGAGGTFFDLEGPAGVTPFGIPQIMRGNGFERGRARRLQLVGDRAHARPFGWAFPFGDKREVGGALRAFIG